MLAPHNDMGRDFRRMRIRGALQSGRARRCDHPHIAAAQSPHVLYLPLASSPAPTSGALCCRPDTPPERGTVRVRALVKRAAEPGMVLTEVPEPTIREDEVLIRVRRAGVCGTDLHIYQWDDWARRRVKPPIIVGHEFAGDVVRVGRFVTDVREGDRVTAEGHIVDGRCLLCRTGNSHVCPHTKIIGVDRDGCFADYIAMPATNVWHLDAATSYEIGGIHDPMGNAFHTALTAQIPGAFVLITGCGPIGLFAVGICKAAGAARVIASDPNDTRLALARRMGADDAVHPRDVERVVRDATDQLGADVVLEMSGVPAAVHQALALVRVGGRVQMLGIPSRPNGHRLRDRSDLQRAHDLRRRRSPDVRHLDSHEPLSARRPFRPDTRDHPPAPARIRGRSHAPDHVGRSGEGGV